MVLWDMRSPSFWSAGYSLHQQAASRFIGTLYGEQYELGLSNNFWWPQNVTPLGEFSGNFSAAVRTTCPGDLPFKFPQSSTPAPVLGSWIKESTFGNQCTPHRRVSHSSVYSWKLYFLSVWGFCFRISQFVLYLSEVFCWREERAVGLSPDLWIRSFLWMLVFVCTESCLHFCLLKNGGYFSYL